MAIDKRGSSLGKNRSSTSKSATASASASKDGGASSSAGPAGTNKLGKVKDTKDKPWSRRVQEAPKPLAAGAGAGGKKRKAADEEVDKVTEESVEQPTLPATAPTTAKPTSSTTASTDRKKKAAAAAVPVLSGYHSTSEDDEEDSSDDDDEDDEVDSDAGPVPGIELSKLPTVAKDDASVKKKANVRSRSPSHVLPLGLSIGWTDRLLFCSSLSWLGSRRTRIVTN
jgi:nucleolar protein 15